MFYNSRARCEFCQRDHKDNCDFEFAQSDKTFKDFISKIRLSSRSHLVLSVVWRQTVPKQLLTMLESKEPANKPETPESNFHLGSSNVSLQDCLKFFTQEELLKGDDKWYCGKCKQHVNATKKMEIYSAPDYLVIHLKRFSHTRGIFGGRKLNSLIQFPIEGLDMTNYLLSHS